MRFKPETYDSILKRLALGCEVAGEERPANPNMLVPWYLMASYAYYEKDDPFLTDGCYDWLCKELDAKWDEIEHRHKPLVEREALSAGTGYSYDWSSLPTIIKNAADHLHEKYESLDEIAPPQCGDCDGTGWFYLTPDLGPCGCPAGRVLATKSIEDLL